MSDVTAVRECPSTSITTRRGTPCASSKLAALCRRSRNRMRGRPARSSIRCRSLVTVEECIGRPSRRVNTSPDSTQSGPASSRSCCCSGERRRSAQAESNSDSSHARRNPTQTDDIRTPWNSSGTPEPAPARLLIRRFATQAHPHERGAPHRAVPRPIPPRRRMRGAASGRTRGHLLPGEPARPLMSPSDAHASAGRLPIREARQRLIAG